MVGGMTVGACRVVSSGYGVTRDGRTGVMDSSRNGTERVLS